MKKGLGSKNTALKVAVQLRLWPPLSKALSFTLPAVTCRTRRSLQRRHHRLDVFKICFRDRSEQASSLNPARSIVSHIGSWQELTFVASHFDRYLYQTSILVCFPPKRPAGIQMLLHGFIVSEARDVEGEETAQRMEGA
jgi:hypothetical protein